MKIRISKPLFLWWPRLCRYTHRGNETRRKRVLWSMWRMWKKRGAQGSFSPSRSVFFLVGRRRLWLILVVYNQCKIIMNYFISFFCCYWKTLFRYGCDAVPGNSKRSKCRPTGNEYRPVTIGVRSKCLHIPRHKLRAHMFVGRCRALFVLFIDDFFPYYFFLGSRRIQRLLYSRRRSVRNSRAFTVVHGRHLLLVLCALNGPFFGGFFGT